MQDNGWAIVRASTPHFPGPKERRMEPVIREIIGPDLAHGFLETLAALAEVNLSFEEAAEVLRARMRAGTRTYVACIGERVIGTASLVIEQKFIHKAGKIGHIEDVAVHPDARHLRVGSALIRHAVEHARRLGCYKVILSCYDRLVPFYEQLGFRKHDLGMRLDLK
jgi:glucosamine-phosphate N-acetyltransferase